MTEPLQTRLPVGGPPPVLRVTDDYGPVGSGVSGAHAVLAENGQEYIVKGPSFAPSHPHVAANEYVAFQLAQAIGLPTMDARIVELAGERLFAAAWMNEGTFHPYTTEDLFSRCDNRDRAYDLVVLDSWIANTDRHPGNLLVREIRPRGAANPRYHMLCNDHSHCLVRPQQSTVALAQLLDSPPAQHVQLAFVIEAITESALLSQALDRVAGIPTETIDAAFAEMPATFVPSPQDARLMREYLLERRERLRGIFRAHRTTFHRLDGGNL